MITAIEKIAPDSERYHFFRAVVLDISLTGLALVVSEHDAAELLAMKESPLMKITLPLASQSIHLTLEPVRSQPLPDGHSKRGVLIGTRIHEMDKDESKHFRDFIRECENK